MNAKRFVSKLILVVLLLNLILPVSLVYAEEQKETMYTTVEQGLGAVLCGLGNAINAILSAAIGEQLTIDDVVFNNYTPTKIDFFSSLKSENQGEVSELIWGKAKDGGNGSMFQAINGTYNFFLTLAIILYMVILVYMGIRILMASTGEQLSQYKTLFMYWIVGLLILFFYPYVMKAMIKVNNAFVETIEENKFIGIENSEKLEEMISSPKKPATIGEDTSINFEENAFAEGGKDYMSKIASDANKYYRFSICFAYLILSWQLITIVVHYYKRLFILAFLVMIFPLVAIFYAVDKVADGKSQAFDKWNKEFILNVFIQSFHAIVYAFVCTTVYATMDSVNGAFDYIIVITGVTFLFTGEEIIKKIFSQESPTGAASSLKDTAGQVAKTAATLKVAKTIGKKIVGKESLYANAKNARAQLKATSARLKAYDKFAAPVEPPNAGMRLEHASEAMATIDSNSALSDSEKNAMKAENKRLANAVATLNNPNSRSIEELADAKNIVDKAMRDDPNNVLLQDLNLTADQMQAFKDIGNEVAQMVAAGEFDPVVINRHVQARLGYSLPGMSEAQQDKYKNMVLADLAFHGACRYENPDQSARTEVEMAMAELENVKNSFTFRDMDEELTDEQKEQRRQIGLQAEQWANSMHDGDEEATEEEKIVARSLAIIANRGSGLYSAKDYMDAMSKLRKNEDSSEIAQEMAETLHMDTDLLRHMMAHEMKDAGVSGYDRNRIDEVIDNYEDDMRQDCYDDELSGHELVALMYEKNDERREAMKQEMIENIGDARYATNQTERQLVRDIAADILAQNEVDITEGGISDKRYFEGQTREDILRDRKRAKWQAIVALGGASGAKTGEYSQDYLNDMDAYDAHFVGDKD